MGILSMMKKKKQPDVVVKEETKKRVKKEFKSKPSNPCESLALYTVSLEILIGMLVDNEEFIDVIDVFRKEWKAEDIINEIIGYDTAFKTMYKKVKKWADKNLVDRNKLGDNSG